MIEIGQYIFSGSRLFFSSIFLCTLVFGAKLSAQFVESSQDYGIQHIYSSTQEGAGLSLIDFNGDGRDDITLATGTGQLLGLYLAQDDGFEAIYPSGLSQLDGAVRSINWVDYDNDGDKDLFVTILNQLPDWSLQGLLRLYRQDGDLEFTDVTMESGIIADNPISYGSVWADYDYDGLLDLHVSGYGESSGGENYLFHNLGDGTFEDVTEQLGMTDLQGKSFTTVFFDADQDGTLDLFTANDRTGSFNTFFRGLGAGTFVDQSVQSGLYTEFDAMGVDVGDYDNDGDFDLYVTNTYSLNYDPLLGGILFQNSGDATFIPFANFPEGTDYGVFWGCSFVDFDYDRDLDLFTVNHGAIGGQHSRKFFVNDGSGGYTDYPGAEFNGGGQLLSGVAQGDVNQDGFLDLVVLNVIVDNSEIWIGPPTTNSHIAIRLEGTVSNRDGIGAIIEVWIDGEKRIDQTSSANSFASQDSDNYRFGIGQAAEVDSVIIRWPSGLVNKVVDVPAGTRLDILESDGFLLDCLPAGDIQYELVPGLDQTFSLVDLVNVDSLDIQWSVEGDFVGTGMEIDHLFDSLGTYTVCANITSSCASYDLCEVFEIACPSPLAFYSLLIDELQIQAEDSSEFSDEVTWFLDGVQIGMGASLEIELDEPGDYLMCQVVTNDCGTDSLCEQITVTCTTPSPGILWTSPADLVLNASLDQTYDSVLWFIDDEIIEGPLLELSFTEGGFYELCAFVWDLCGIDSTCVLVEIECETPIADFTWTQDSLAVQVIDLSVGDTVLWTLNDEPLLLSEESTFELPFEGVYALCAEVTDTCGVALYCDSIFVDFTSGFAEYYSLEEQIEFWPNPVQEVLHVKSNEPIMLYVMMDLSGRMIETDHSLGQGLEFDLRLGHLERGAYCLILEGASGRRYPIFFIKGRP